MKNLFNLPTFALVALLTVFSSCAKEEVAPNTTVSSVVDTLNVKAGGKLYAKDSFNYKGQRFNYRLFDLGTEHSAMRLEITNGVRKLDLVVQANEDFSGYDLVIDPDDINMWCWDCVGECVESVVDNNTALVVMMTPFCPECTVAFVGGALLGCTAGMISEL